MKRSEADTPATLSPWQPEQRKMPLAVLGKLLEEIGELSAIAARCVIQGIDEVEPETGALNRATLEKELADVMAGIQVAIGAFDLNNVVIERRMQAKVMHLLRWHRLLQGDSDEPAIDGRANARSAARDRRAGDGDAAS